jgi:LmbE family N-acetylglucosaminyl deacetylase
MFRDPKHVIANPISGSTDIVRWRALNRSSLLSGRPGQPTWESLVADLTSLLIEIRPTVIVAPHPALDAAPDHVFTTAALLDALGDAPSDSLQLLLYTNHHALSEYYPFGPADAVVTLPPWSDTTVLFRSVHSHWLDDRTQRDKLFALDQMHDLRDEPARVLSGPAMTLLKRVAGMGADILRDPTREYSYFRRAARPNELFFVYDVSDIDAIRRSVSARVSSETTTRPDSVSSRD